MPQGRFAGSRSVVVHQNPQVHFYRAAFQLGEPPCVSVHQVVPSQVQDFAFSLVEPCEVFVSPFLQPVEVPANGRTNIWCIICKLAEGCPCPSPISLVNGTGLAVNPWTHTISDWPPAGLHLADRNTLGPPVQPVFSPPYCSSVLYFVCLSVSVTGDCKKPYQSVGKPHPLFSPPLLRQSPLCRSL